MRYRLHLILLGGLMWAATGCCCYDPCCCSYNACNYPLPSYGYGVGYNTVSTGVATSTGVSTTALSTGNSSYIAGNQSKYSATAGGVTNYQPTTSPQAYYPPTNGTTTAYNSQGVMMPQQSYVGDMTQYGNLCPCESSDIPMGTYMQDANGMPIPMEGMVYDASNAPMPLTTMPATPEADAKSGSPKPGELISVPTP